jgi:hypothetical protein
MASQTNLRGPCVEIVEHAVTAHDAGHRLVCSWMNGTLKRFSKAVSIDIDPPDANMTLATIRLALSNAMTGFRGYVPTLEPDNKLMPWMLFYYLDDEKRAHGGYVSLTPAWTELELDPIGERFWRSEFLRRLELCKAETWKEKQWRQGMVEPVLEYAQQSREWLMSGGQDGNAPLPHLLTRRVRLNGQEQRPTVDGIPKKRLSQAQYNVLQALLESNDEGLSLDQMRRKSGHMDAPGILNRLAKSDPDWDSVISMAGIPGAGYRVL